MAFIIEDEGAPDTNLKPFHMTFPKGTDPEAAAKAIIDGKIDVSNAPVHRFVIEDETPKQKFVIEEKPKESTFKKIKGVGEAALTVGSGALSWIPAGIMKAATLGEPDGVSDFGEKLANQTQEKLTYQPKTETGKKIAGAIAYPFEKISEGSQIAADYVYDKTGSPILATATRTAGEAIPFVAPVAVGKGLKIIKKGITPPKGMEDLKFEPKGNNAAISPEVPRLVPREYIEAAFTKEGEPLALPQGQGFALVQAPNVYILKKGAGKENLDYTEGTINPDLQVENKPFYKQDLEKQMQKKPGLGADFYRDKVMGRDVFDEITPEKPAENAPKTTLTPETPKRIIKASRSPEHEWISGQLEALKKETDPGAVEAISHPDIRGGVDNVLKEAGYTSRQLKENRQTINDFFDGKEPPTEGKTTKAALDINKTLTEQGFAELPESELAKYTPITKADQVNKVSSLLTTDKQKAYRMAKGHEQIPNDIHPQVLFNAVKNEAIKSGDVDTLMDLAKSPIAEERSIAAQTLGASGFDKVKNDFVDKIRSVQKARESKIKNPKVKPEIIAKLKKEVKKINLSKEELSWDRFLKKIEC